MGINEIRVFWVSRFASLKVSCKPYGLIRPSKKIRSFWVNLSGYNAAEFIWGFCNMSLAAMPFMRTLKCNTQNKGIHYSEIS